MRRGFTLIEMIGVVIILSMLMLISGVAITRIVKKSKTELSDAQKNNIKMAAQLWAEDNLDTILSTTGCNLTTLNGCCVQKTVNDLGDYLSISNITETTNISTSLSYVEICATKSSGNVNLTYETHFE